LGGRREADFGRTQARRYRIITIFDNLKRRGYSNQVTPPGGGTEASVTMPQTITPQKDIIKRLRSAEGHVRAIANMVEQGAYCMDIINQSHAVIEALKKVNTLVLEGYLGECAFDAVNSKDAAKRKKAVAELVNLYSKK
jgi:CsoR family transcriptional regulator, copper-sensing transcriptional repressor